MMKWQSRRIGDFIHRVKDSVTLEDGIEYKQVTIRMNYKGVVLRGLKRGCDIKTKNQWRVRSGLFILSRIDARNGAFGIIPEELEGAIVSNDFLAYEIDQAEVDIEFFNSFLQSPIFLEACIKASRGNTNRKRVNENFFLDYQVELPTLSEQQRLITRINKAKDCIGVVDKEIIHQETLLAKLKQAILQEAIQGKLTADWQKENPDVEPAGQLLERIQKEKQRLIAEKKIRKEKPLPTITPEEIPFEIPDSWAWCRFGEVITLISGQHIAVADYNANGKGIPYLPGPSDFGAMYPIYSRWTTNPKVCANAGDILVTVKGSGVGKMNSLIDDGVAIGRQLMAVRRIILNWGYVWNFLASEYHALQDAKEGQIPGISREDITHKLVPVPSLAEQAAIVERVEASMDSCRQLETEIKHSRIHAENLLQTVLKEAFTAT